MPPRGQKKQQELAKRHAVTIDGYELVWHVESQPRYTTENGHEGLRIFARLASDSIRRELRLEFPIAKEDLARPRGGAYLPEPIKIVPATIEAGIRLALEAGWNPTSRGRPFNFQLADGEL